MKKAKVDLTAEAVMRAVADGAKNMSDVVHALGFRSVCGATTAKIRALVPDLAERLKSGGEGKVVMATRKAAVKPTKGEAKPAGKSGGRWPRDPRNVFRVGSAYGVAFDILAAHPDGLMRARLVELLAEATGKTPKLAGYDAQVVLSAHPNEDGLSHNDSPRHRSCRPGFYVVRTGDNVRLMVD